MSHSNIVFEVSFARIFVKKVKSMSAGRHEKNQYFSAENVIKDTQKRSNFLKFLPDVNKNRFVFVIEIA